MAKAKKTARRVRDTPALQKHVLKSLDAAIAKRLREWLDIQLDGQKALMPDGLDAAILGWTLLGERRVAVCSVERAIAELERQGMTRVEAKEFFSYNVEDGPENGPIWVNTPE